MTTLYKYQDWTQPYVQKSFIESSYHFAKNFSFNDPFDLQLPTLLDNTSLLDYLISEEEKSLNRKLNHVELEYLKIIVERNQDKVSRGIEDLRRQMEEAHAENEGNCGILCMSSINNSTLMWGHYANKHSGICLGLSLDKLLKYLPYYTKSRVFYGPVTYANEMPRMDYLSMEDEEYLFNENKKRLTTKSTDWEYEQEWRIIVSQYANKLIHLPNDVLMEVIFGYRLPDEEREVIKELCKERYPHVNLYQASPNPSMFKIDIKEV